jgi:hypothetical protein
VTDHSTWVVPDEMSIGGSPHTIWYDKDAISAGGVRGQYLGDERKVLLDRTLPLEVQLRTLLHEAFHGIFGMSTLTSATPDSPRELSEEMEEKLCNLIERELPSLFRENPWLLDLLREPTRAVTTEDFGP